MSDSIAADKVVSFLYTLRLADGREVDSSPVDEPLVYLHGKKNVIPGLEQQLEGKAVGDKINAVVPPDLAYGDRTPDGIQQVPRNAFPPDIELTEGQQLAAQGEDGEPLPMRIVELKEDLVTVDLNHPLAGETLHFDVEILTIRDATSEELTHGHPHGDGGCGHDH